MERKLYAACPRCGMRAEIARTYWDWDSDQDIALVRCKCTRGPQPVPFLESRVMKVDLDYPYMHDENDHFDLLLPPGWNEAMWEKLRAVLTKW